jgi:catechol 2,3-dioxygenase-like lactoylglutathione lyase family enzyme
MKLSEIAFFTDDVASMTAFYRSLLGSEPAYQSGDLAIFDHAGVHILIHQAYVPGPADLPPDNHLAFAVPDVDAACVALKGAGLEFSVPPRDYDWGRSAYLHDPDGHLIELQQG